MPCLGYAKYHFQVHNALPMLKPYPMHRTNESDLVKAESMIEIRSLQILLC
jgi:hypothetical protein